MIYVTEYYKDGLRYSGRVEAINLEDAKVKASPDKVIGRLIAEIPIDIHGNPDFKNQIDHDSLLWN